LPPHSDKQVDSGITAQIVVAGATGRTYRDYPGSIVLSSTGSRGNEIEWHSISPYLALSSFRPAGLREFGEAAPGWARPGNGGKMSYAFTAA